MKDAANLAEKIISNFIKIFNRFRDEGLITSHSLTKYWDFNIHSILQYLIISAGIESNIIALPEYRFRLSKPIDKQSIDPRLRVKRRYMRTLRADVGFLINGELAGIGEIYTPDEIHGCLPSTALEEPWITPYHKLLHLVDHEKNLDFVVLVVGIWRVSEWKDARRRSLDEWFACWNNLIYELGKKKKLSAVLIRNLDTLITMDGYLL